MGGQKFGVLLCAEDSDHVKKLHGGYYGVFIKMLKEDGEAWDVFRVAKGEFPSDDEIGDYEGFVITGSCNDAHGNDQWVCKLLILLKKLDAMKKRLLGICFGHQILGRAIGGKVGRAISGWDIGITKVYLNPSSHKIFTPLKMPPSLNIIECHRDEVLELPPKAEILAWSEKTGVEMFRYSDHILAIQGHPEYTKDILLHLIDHRLLSLNLIEESFADEARSKLDACEPDRDEWKKLCTDFLKGRFCDGNGPSYY